MVSLSTYLYLDMGYASAVLFVGPLQSAKEQLKWVGNCNLSLIGSHHPLKISTNIVLNCCVSWMRMSELGDLVEK